MARGTQVWGAGERPKRLGAPEPATNRKAKLRVTSPSERVHSTNVWRGKLGVESAVEVTLPNDNIALQPTPHETADDVETAQSVTLDEL